MNTLTPFEKEIKKIYHLPNINQSFFEQLETEIQTCQLNREEKSKRSFHLSLGWGFIMIAFFAIISFVIAIGPSKVLAQLQAIFGFVPEIGLVDTSSSFRQLKTPVSVTRDGITLSIQSAFLSADQTILSYTISDLPEEVIPSSFGEPICNMPAYIILPNNDKIEAVQNSGILAQEKIFSYEIRFDQPVPENFDRFNLFFPCLEGTIQGKGPQNWQIPLNIQSIPEKIMTYPVTLVPSENHVENSNLLNTDPVKDLKTESNGSIIPASIIDGIRKEDMVVLSVVEKSDSYWVTWAYPNQYDKDIQSDGYLYLTPFNPILYDANGNRLPDPNQQTQRELWKYEDSLRSHLSDENNLKYIGTMHTFTIPKSGIIFPVYIKQNVYERSFPEKESFMQMDFDGNRIQATDLPFHVNQHIQIGSIDFILETIEKEPNGGYSFLFDGTDDKVIQCQIDTIGYQTNLKGSSSFDPDDPFHFRQELFFQVNPGEKISIRISQPAVLGDLISFTGSWSPQK